MKASRHTAARRLLILALVVLFVNAGFLLIAHAQEGPAISSSDMARLYLPMVLQQPVVVPPTPTPTETVTPTATPPPPSDMVLIPAGSFQMGCDPAHNGGYKCESDELPLHAIYLDSYRIDRTEVTTAQYAQCVAEGACTSLLPSYDNENPVSPVVWVRWSQADAYCRWLGKRLPTEAEWEKAARGPRDTRAFPWGDDLPNCTLANYRIEVTAGGCIKVCFWGGNAVDSYLQGASPYGVLNMAGNIHEWVNDWVQSDYYSVSPTSNPTGPATGTSRMSRGGAWWTPRDYLRVASRLGLWPDGGGNWVEFRCAAAP